MSDSAPEPADPTPVPALPAKEDAKATVPVARNGARSLRSMARRSLCRCRGVCGCRRRKARGTRRSTPIARSVLAILENGGPEVQALMANALLAVRASSSPLAFARLLVDVQAHTAPSAFGDRPDTPVDRSVSADKNGETDTKEVHG